MFTIASLFQCLQQKTFDNTYGLYHILLDKHLKTQRKKVLEQKSYSDFTHLEGLTLDPEPGSPEIENKGVTFETIEPQELIIEEGEPDQAELAKYFSRRRETIAVSHITPSPRNAGLMNQYNMDQVQIPEISICPSPSPPNMEKPSKLQYKEQYLPRPAVLQVRPQFDRRASDGSATLQDSIAQFNMRRSQSKANPSVDVGRSNNLCVIEDDSNGGSESDTEPDMEAVNRYLEKGRGSRKRHTFSSILETPVEDEESVGSLKAFHQQLHMSKSRTKLERETRSPVPYLPVSPESRRNITGERRPSDGSLTVHLYTEKKKEEPDSLLKQIHLEHKKLQNQYGTNASEYPRPPRRNSSHNHLREGLRCSYPSYQENTDTSSIVQQLETELSPNDPCLAMLHQKQEAQQQNLLVKFLVERKILERQMEDARRELIRRASEGAPRLESSIAEFLAQRESSKNVPPTTDIQPNATELQDEMKKLNLQVSSGLPGSMSHEPVRFNDELFDSSAPTYTSSLLPSPGRMDIDDSLPDRRSEYRYANPQALFNSPYSRSRNSHLLPLAPNFGVSRMNSPYGTATNAMHAPEIQSPLVHNGGILWSTMNPDEDITTTSSENLHKTLTSSLSVDLTTSLTTTDAVDEVKRCLDEHKEIDYSQSDTFFSLYKEGVQVEIEVCPLTKNSPLNGIKIRHIGGDKWIYKKMRNEILTGLQL